MDSILDFDFKPFYIEKPSSEPMLGFSHYPVINEHGEFIGIVEEDAYVNLNTEDLLSMPGLIIQRPIHPQQCLAEMKKMNSNILFLVEDGHYYGAITHNSLLNYLKENTAHQYNGAILQVKVPYYIFSLSEFCRLAESEGLKILSFEIQEDGEEHLKIEFKFQSNDLKHLIGILENKGYLIISLYNERGFQRHLQDRYENLLSYLNI